MDDLNEFSQEMAGLFADNAFETLDTNGIVPKRLEERISDHLTDHHGRGWEALI